MGQIMIFVYQRFQLLHEMSITITVFFSLFSEGNFNVKKMYAHKNNKTEWLDIYSSKGSVRRNFEICYSDKFYIHHVVGV